MTWNSDHFTGNMALNLAFFSTHHVIGVDWDSRRKKNGVFRFTGPGVHEGWSQHVDNELGNYDYLLGIYSSIARCDTSLTITLGVDVSSDSR
jgi:alpha-amylase